MFPIFASDTLLTSPFRGRFGRVVICGALCLLLGFPAMAERPPSEVEDRFGDAEPLGQVVFRWLGLPIYEATLFTESGRDFDWNEPLALQLVYTRSFSGTSLVNATIAELERIEGASEDYPELRGKLESCFNDVSDGDRYVAIAYAPDRVDFLLNGRQTCSLRHRDAKERVLGIWLSEDSRSAALARRLRGQ
ncbi:MAG: hypothetical protein OEZ19_11130 [Paracoccaceae bacterium]|nr:hypothetical protein [Paracoccaceae bacterium]